MSAPPDREGNTFEMTRRWQSASIILEALLSLAVIALIAGLAFAYWSAFAQKSDTFASAASKRSAEVAVDD